MKLSVFRLALAALITATHVAAIRTLSQVTIFTPPQNYTDPQVLFARTAELPNHDLLATWENYSPEPPPVYFPIYRSRDSGTTWTEISRVQDQGYGYGLRYQPFLYVLPKAIGKYPAGTEFLSHVAAGGEAIPDNGLTPVWEPFLLLHAGKLIFYYSDQRDPAHGQKLVHQTSTDLKTWSGVVDDISYPTYTDRPGLASVAALPNGQYIYTYEYGGGPNPNATGYTFPVYYRLSSDPENFIDAEHHLLQSSDGTVPNGSPYVVWTPAGGINGTIVVSSGCCTPVYVNKALGAEGAWQTLSTPEGVSYTRSLRVFQEDPRYVLIAGAGQLPPSTTNKVTISVIKV
ncbi:glycoside hydrolase family 93 protein [Xylariaceae sp. FL1651]|nr:glycoside hydrolase family 93 protein [Xylariaceae sp. FL1651]